MRWEWGRSQGPDRVRDSERGRSMTGSGELGEATGPELSVVAPLYNEEECAGLLVDAVRSALVAQPLSWELILVDDGSRDRTAEIVAAAAAADPRVRLLRMKRNFGQTQAMQAGFDAARGRVLVGMDGDLQNDPRDIPLLVAKLDEGYDLVAGYRVRRQDAFLSRRVPSWAANHLIQWITRVPIRDNGCSLKAYRRETVARMHLYADMHRFLPALAAATAGARICEIPVRHHARAHGSSKYGASRIVKLLADLLTLALIAWFRERPLRLFGFAAAAAFALALPFALGAALTWDAPVHGATYPYVFPTAALVFLLLAGYLMLLGLVAEVALRRSRDADDEPLPIVVERAP